jgi:hypothetical protein
MDTGSNQAQPTNGSSGAEQPPLSETPPPVSNGSAADKPPGASEASEESEAQEFFRSLGIETGDIRAEQVTLANEVHYHQLSDEGRTQKLSLQRHFEVWTRDRLSDARKKLHFDPDEVSEVAVKLQERRILILAGEPESGKTSRALLIASSLWSTTARSLEEVALCRYLPGQLRVDLADLTGREKGFRRRLLILKNAFAGKNEDLLRFACQLSESQLETYTLQLRASDAFLVLTADSTTLPGSRETLRGFGILEEVPRPSRQDMHQGLEQLFQRFTAERREQADDPVFQQAGRVLAENRDKLTAELGSMPRLARFVREYLLDVARATISLDDALKRINELGSWLLEELPDDPDVWCAVVALTLCSADRSLQGVPWFKFEALRRALFQFLRRDFPPERRRREIRDLCRTEQVLKRAQAQVATASFPLPDVVRFEDPRLSDRLWQTLLGPGRGVAASLIPLLRSLTFNEDAYLRQCAAQALGRIGRIDPFYVTYPLIDEWSEPHVTSQANALDRGILLGHLFEGIRSVEEDKAYQRSCLQILRWSARNARSRTVQIVLFSLHQISTLDRECFAFTMEILKEVAEKRLNVRWKALHELSDKLRDHEETARLIEYVYEARGSVEETMKRSEQLLQRVAVNDHRILEAFRFTLLGLLLWPRFQGETLRRLLDWVYTNPEHFGPLVAVAFLGRGGISHWLERTGSPGQDAGEEKDEEGSLLLEAIRNEEEAQVLCAFLEILFSHLRAFPGLLRDAFEQSFLRLLASWAREARASARLHDPVADLFARLFASRDEELSERMLRLAQEPAAAPEFEDLRVLVVEAITGRRGRGTSS